MICALNFVFLICTVVTNLSFYCDISHGSVSDLKEKRTYKAKQPVYPKRSAICLVSSLNGVNFGVKHEKA